MKEIKDSITLNGKTYEAIQIDFNSYNVEEDSINVGDNTYYASKVEGLNEEKINVDKVFGNNSWKTISSVSAQIASQNMTAEQVETTYGWNIGDIKTETLSTGEEIQVRIIDFNHDTLSNDHSTKAGITMQMVNCLATRYPINSSNTNKGGWGASKMRTETMPTIKATLSQDLQNVIKLVDKKAANGGGSNYSATETLNDDLFLLAGVEIFGSKDGYGNAKDGANEGTQYAYWQGKTANDRIKKYDKNGDSISETETYWWERSSFYNLNQYFCAVGSTGEAKGDQAGSTYPRGVAFGFCV